MANTKPKKTALVETLNELIETVRKTNFDLFLHYSNEHDGWRAKLGSVGTDGRWKDADAPQPLIDVLRDARKPLLAQFAQNDRRQEERSRRASKPRRR